MRVLFISSGNRGYLSPIVKNQGDSIIQQDPNISVEYYLVEGKGVRGYLNNIPRIRIMVNRFKPDLIHAHYSFCGILSVFAFLNVPIVVSLMGSDVNKGRLYSYVVKIFSSLFWKATILKSEDMMKKIKLSKAFIIPNGVDLNKFKVIDKIEARKKLNWGIEDITLLFAANPLRPEKNWNLAENAIKLLNTQVEVKFLANIPNNETIFYYNAADVVLLSSFWEGSPNVIKEAMACCRPTVSSNVGDVKNNTVGLDGYYVSTESPQDFSDKIKLALLYNKQTKGRQRIIDLKLDSESVAKRIIDIYRSIY